jgi:hypothetical protein
MQKGKGHTSNSNKETMKNWLHVRNIPFCDTMVRVQLYEIIRAYKSECNKTFLVDGIMAADDGTVWNLLLYHPDLNPIESVWVDVKQCS